MAHPVLGHWMNMLPVTLIMMKCILIFKFSWQGFGNTFYKPAFAGATNKGKSNDESAGFDQLYSCTNVQLQDFYLKLTHLHSN